MATALLTQSHSASAQIKKGEKYLLTIPLDFFPSWESRPFGAYRAKGTIKLTEAGKVLVNEKADWLSADFPNGVPFLLTKDSTDKKTTERLIRLYLQTGSAPREVDLTFPDERTAQAALGELLISPSDSEKAQEFEKRALSALAEKRFPESLTTLPMESRLTFLKQVRIVLTPSLGISTYKERRYLSLDLGRADAVYNTNQVGQVQRVARAIGQTLIQRLRQTNELVPSLREPVFGIRLVHRIPWRDFTQTLNEGGQDVLELYVPTEKLRQFIAADITSQAMINDSVVIVDGNRIEVPLSQQ